MFGRSGATRVPRESGSRVPLGKSRAYGSGAPDGTGSGTGLSALLDGRSRDGRDGAFGSGTSRNWGERSASGFRRPYGNFTDWRRDGFDRFDRFDRFGRRSLFGRYPYYRHRHHRNYFYGLRFCYASPFVYAAPYYSSRYYGPYDYGYSYGTSVIYDYPSTPSYTTVYDQDVYYVTEPAEASGGGAVARESGTVIYERPAAVAPSVGAAAESGAADELAGPPVPSAVDEANQAFAKGDFGRARQLYVQAILADEEDGFVRLFYGVASFAVEDYFTAGASIRRGLTLEPELIDNPIDVRSLYGDAAQFGSQMASLVRYVESNPRDLEARFVLGYLHYASVQPELALTVLEQVVAADPGDELATQVREAARRVAGGRD